MNWTSPAVLRGNTRDEDLVLLQSPKRFTADDPHSGEQVWSYEVACSSIPSPVAEGNTIYVPSGGLTALRCPAGRQGGRSRVGLERVGAG